MSSPLQPAHLKLAAQLRDKLAPTPSPAMFWAVVTAVTVSPNAVSVKIAGSSTVITGIRYDASLTPTVNMTVWGWRTGTDYFVVGQRA